MSEQKKQTAKIIFSKFTKQWEDEKVSGKFFYCHEVKLDNGIDADCISTQINPDFLKEGRMIDYEYFPEKNRIKRIAPSKSKKKSGKYGKSPSEENPKQSSMTKPEGRVRPIAPPNARQGKQDAYLGFAWAYAKDMVIAGKTMEHVDEMNKIARYIYDNIGEMMATEGPTLPKFRKTRKKRATSGSI